eukprot:gene19535-22210_t
MTQASRRTVLKNLVAATALLPLKAPSARSQAQAQPAQPSGAPSPHRGPVPKDWTDPRTGRRIIRISDEDASGVLYFYRHAYTPEGDVMVIKSPSGIAAVRLKDWKTTLLIKGKENELLFMLRTTREAVYSVTDPGEGEAAQRPKSIYAIHVDTKKVRQLARIEAGSINGANADYTLLLGAVSYGAKPLQPKDAASVQQFGQAEYAALGPDGKPLNFAKAKGVRMMERFTARVPAELFTIDLRTGARKVLYKTEDWIGHAQFSPTDPKLIRFCMEGPWQPPYEVASEKHINLALARRRLARRFGGEEPAEAEQVSQVLMDDNLMELTKGRPFPLKHRAKLFFHKAVQNDTLFLSIVNVVDYSILVGFDENTHEVVVGIIDYMRQYDIIKKMERMGKSVGMIAGQAEPTIIQPSQYRKRFSLAMERYFMTIPDKWITHES